MQAIIYSSPRKAPSRGAFALVFLLVFFVTFGFLSLVGATPDSAGAVGPAPAKGDFSAAGQRGDATKSLSAGAAPLVALNLQHPVRVVAKEIGLDASVSNPGSTDVALLDHAALSGAVRYPTSASLGEDGTMILFGHSSYLPIVHNQAYKTFDGIQNLKEGSVVSVYSATAEYRYRVVGVEVANATRDVLELKPDGKHLTLVTCDSFATKSNRFVVTADFVGTYSLTSN